MQGIAPANGSRVRAATIATMLGLATLIMDACAQAQEPGHGPGGAPQLPSEIRGFWDLAPYPCVVGPHGESDSRLEMGADFVRGYEELMEVREVQKVSDVPPAWRVLTVSAIAPPELQGPALYVLTGHSLTIADAGQARSYVRCRAVSTIGDES